MYKTSGYQNAGIYIIDEHFRIQYFNEEIARLYPNLTCGGYCYRELCQEDDVCRACAVLHKEQNGSMHYNRVLGIWVEVNCAKVDWPGCGPCTMVITRMVRERNRNLLYNLTNIAAYDELLEINLSRHTYKLLEFREDKYRQIPAGGTDVQLAARIREGIIHPDDLGDFRKFWDIDRMQRLNEQEKKTGLKTRFRRQLLDGTYHWVQLVVVPLEYDDIDELIFMCFFQDVHEQVAAEKIRDEHDSVSRPERDSLTGLYWHSGFFREAQQLLEHTGAESYCLLAVDIEHFKLYNEWYGREAGDEFLIHIASYLKQMEHEMACVAGYMGGDDFAILLPNRPGCLDELQEQINEGARKYGQNAGFLPAFGLYSIEDKTVPISTMYDRAMIALGEVKGNYAQRLKQYDNRMIGQLEEDHILLSEVQRALDQGEFIYYLQPQCNMETGKIVGFEALVRWQHPTRGMISPAGFVPLLEKNGFITTLDCYVWNRICADLRGWLDRGIRPVPISVNVSRVDFLVMDVAGFFGSLTERYDLDPQLVEIEITETSYAEEYRIIVGVVKKLRAAGFRVLMDDFGSGYSSLNMLKDINVDVLKLDMKLLDMDDQSQERGMGILRAIVSMARFMGISLIAEGVETKEQTVFLLEMGCSCAQGYYFHKPLPAADCLPMMKDPAHLDYGGIRLPKADHKSIRELMDENGFSETTLDQLLGDAIIDAAEGAELRRHMRTLMDYLPVNIGLMYIGEDRYRFQMLVTGLAAGSGYTDDEYLERIRLGKYLADIFPEDALRLQADMDAAVANRHDYRGLVRFRHPEGSGLWMDIHARYVSDSTSGVIYLCMLSDVSEIREQELKAEYHKAQE